MATSTVNIAFQKDLLRQIDQTAKEESRSRSDLLREAARAYIGRKRRWADLLAMGKGIANSNNLTRADVSREIRAYRKNKTSGP